MTYFFYLSLFLLKDILKPGIKIDESRDVILKITFDVLIFIVIFII